MFEFSQEDILKNKILFRHKKNDFGRFVFWVKDDSGTVATGKLCFVFDLASYCFSLKYFWPITYLDIPAYLIIWLSSWFTQLL